MLTQKSNNKRQMIEKYKCKINCITSSTYLSKIGLYIRGASLQSANLR